MDSIKSESDDKNVETTTTASNEDVLVVLQTKSGEQIALPMSALPSDFVPDNSGQIIMVEGSLDEQQQEVVVESSDVTENQTNVENLISISTDTNGQITTTNILTNDSTSTSADISSSNELCSTATNSITSINSGDKPVPRTYSKNNVVKSYTPTHTDSTSTNNCTDTDTTSSVEPTNPTPENPMPPRKKQKRKETLLTRPLNDEDIELKFQIVEEPQPMVQEIEVKRKPRKEYRTKKKVRLAMEKMSKEEYASVAREMELRDRGAKRKRQELSKKDDSREETDKDDVIDDADELKNEEVKRVEMKKYEVKEEDFKKEDVRKDEIKRETTRGLRREMPRRDLPNRVVKEKTTIETPQPPQHQQQPQSERRTRLSNACRVATGKSYKCNDCDFSTDRINNIILHVKESCPKLKKT